MEKIKAKLLNEENKRVVYLVAERQQDCYLNETDEHMTQNIYCDNGETINLINQHIDQINNSFSKEELITILKDEKLSNMCI